MADNTNICVQNARHCFAGLNFPGDLHHFFQKGIWSVDQIYYVTETRRTCVDHDQKEEAVANIRVAWKGKLRKCRLEANSW